MSHMANLCNVSMIVASLIYVILKKLEPFVANKCGGVSLNPSLVEFEW